VLNRVPHKGLDKSTPYELWKGVAPNLNYIKVWVCFTKVGLPHVQRSKNDPKTVDAIFISHPHNSVAYRFVLKDDYGFGAIRESQDPEFFECTFSYESLCDKCSPARSTLCHKTTSYSNLEQELR